MNENKSGLPDMKPGELDAAADLAFDLDEFFRAHNSEYARRFPDAHKKKEDLAGCLSTGHTIEIKRLLDHMGQDHDDVLNVRLAAYEETFGKPGRNLIPRPFRLQQQLQGHGRLCRVRR